METRENAFSAGGACGGDGGGMNQPSSLFSCPYF